jgi:UDP-N-acetylglucosamine kinase
MSTDSQSLAAIQWVKSQTGRRQIIEKFASRRLCPSVDDPYAVFMAGTPGAGKTEVSKTLIEQLGVPVVHIDADAIRAVLPQYKINNADVVQGAAALGVEKLFDWVLKKKQSFVLDGTFSSQEKAVNNIYRALDHGRYPVVLYLYQEPDVAWGFTKKREFREGRSVPAEVFMEAYFAARKTVNEVKRIYGARVQLNCFVKNYEHEVVEVFQDVTNVDTCIPEKYSVDNIMDICTRPLSQ